MDKDISDSQERDGVAANSVGIASMKGKPRRRSQKPTRNSLDGAPGGMFKLNGDALDRIISAVGSAPPLDREKLRADLEWLPDWRTILKSNPKQKRADLERILTAAKRLKGQLIGDAWSSIASRLSIIETDPRDVLAQLIDAVGRIVGEIDNCAMQAAKRSKPESPLEVIAGKLLPSIFERHFNRARGRSRKDGTPDGPCVRFVKQSMMELGMPYDGESIIRAMSRAKGTAR
jgi:hypothetical protein